VQNPTGPADGSYRGFRGGSWRSNATSTRSSYRNWLSPFNRDNNLGFRLAKSL